MKKVHVINALSVPVAVTAATARTLSNPFRAKRYTHGEYYHGTRARAIWNSLDDEVTDCEACTATNLLERIRIAGETWTSFRRKEQDTVTNYCDKHRSAVRKYQKHKDQREGATS